jgi:quercetin dioxygenase-like cupin family protein
LTIIWICQQKNTGQNEKFQGQEFCHHKSREAKWIADEQGTFEYCDTGVSEKTKGLASVKVIRFSNKDVEAKWINSDSDILFQFVLEGEIELLADGHRSHILHKGDSVVIPPHLKHKIAKSSDDLELLEVSIPRNL